ncbi:migration and invasion-inhibitory protein isoform X2 [Hypomesus transpacificus]|uniref:migration and invasion-inhibitory protein isoform X2 n=1 Tax=Hypomesus transpacificus TaxID=137520 RepID=UPI001F07EC6B|nr:migration and invasion-inhibitory protein isoform X2 [Hypomesus transpacificus]
MSSTEGLNVLRERNQDLLLQLRHQTERLKKSMRSEASITRVNSEATAQNMTSGQRSVVEKDSTITEVSHLLLVQNEENRNPADFMVTLTDANRGPAARAALGKPAVRFNEIITVAPLRTAAPSLMIETSQSHVGDGQAVYTGLLRDRGNSRTRGHVRSQVSRRSDARPVVYNQEQREMGRVTEQPPGWEQGTASDRRRMQPLLGYDWIAGLLDAESSLTERSEEFFSDLRTFRQVNRDQCVHSLHVGLLEDEVPPQHLSAEEEATEQTDTHQCTFCYRINGRLFPASLDPQESCPVCKMPKADHPHSAAEPAFIRVSIPRSTLLPAYQYKAHRRCSFDPSDSLGLPSHCLSGWSNPAPSSLPLASSLDLRSYLRNTAPPTGLASALPQPGNQQEDLSVSRVSGSTRSDQLLNVSRLARYHIQRLPPANKPACCSSYPVL